MRRRQSVRKAGLMIERCPRVPVVLCYNVRLNAAVILMINGRQNILISFHIASRAYSGSRRPVGEIAGSAVNMIIKRNFNNDSD